MPAGEETPEDDLGSPPAPQHAPAPAAAAAARAGGAREGPAAARPGAPGRRRLLKKGAPGPLPPSDAPGAREDADAVGTLDADGPVVARRRAAGGLSDSDSGTRARMSSASSGAAEDGADGGRRAAAPPGSGHAKRAAQGQQSPSKRARWAEADDAGAESSGQRMPASPTPPPAAAGDADMEAAPVTGGDEPHDAAALPAAGAPAGGGGSTARKRSRGSRLPNKRARPQSTDSDAGDTGGCMRSPGSSAGAELGAVAASEAATTPPAGPQEPAWVAAAAAEDAEVGDGVPPVQTGGAEPVGVRAAGAPPAAASAEELEEVLEDETERMLRELDAEAAASCLEDGAGIPASSRAE